MHLINVPNAIAFFSVITSVFFIVLYLLKNSEFKQLKRDFVETERKLDRTLAQIKLMKNWSQIKAKDRN